MVSVDLYRMWPSIRRSSRPADVGVSKGCATTLDLIPGQETARRADPGRVRDLLSQLVTEIEGQPLSNFVPLAQTIPLLIGLTPQNLAAFDEYLSAFIGTVVGDLGRVVTPPSVTSPSDSVSANRRFLSAKALGVKAAEDVRPARPATAQRFDDMLALFSEGATLAAVLGDADDGLPPATAEIIGAILTAIRSNLRSGSPDGARQAGKDAGILIAAAHAAFFAGETSERANRRPMRQVGKAHYVAPGYESVRVRKRAHVKAVDVDGEAVPIHDAEIDLKARKFVRRRRRRKE